MTRRRPLLSPGARLALKAAITLALIAILLWRTDLGALRTALVAVDTPWLAALAGLMLVFGLASAARWFRVLARLGERPPWRAILGDTFVGMTYNMLLPTTVGGDVIRALRCSPRVSHKHRAWSSVLYERVAGLLAMALAGAIAIAIAPRAELGVLRWVAVASAVVLAIAFIQLSAPFRVVLRVLRARIPGSPELLTGLARDLDGPLAAAGPRVETMAWSVLCVALGYAYSIVSALSLGDPSAVIPLLLGLPVIFIGSMIPITISGLGLREGLFVVVLGQLGVDRTIALAIAVQALAGLLFVAFGGLLVLLAEHFRRR